MKTSKACRWWLGAAAAITLLWGSCTNPLDRDMVRQLRDSVAPTIVVTYPAEGSPYGATVLIEGHVTDTATSAEDAGRVETLDYAVLGTAISGSVAFEADGSFSFTFPVSTLMMLKSLRETPPAFRKASKKVAEAEPAATPMRLPFMSASVFQPLSAGIISPLSPA